MSVKGRGYGANRLAHDPIVAGAFNAGAAAAPTTGEGSRLDDGGKAGEALDKAAVALLKAIAAQAIATPGDVLTAVIERAILEAVNVDGDRASVVSIQGRTALAKAADGQGKTIKGKVAK
jgi:hypothetical protein